MMLISCCLISGISYVVNLNLDLCLKHGSTLMMWLVSGLVSSSPITAVSLNGAGSSLSTVKQQSFASLKIYNPISAASIAVTVVMLCLIQFLCLLMCVSDLMLIRYSCSLLTS